MTCHFARLLDDGEPIVGLSGQLDSIKMSAQTLSHAIYELFRLDVIHKFRDLRKVKF